MNIVVKEELAVGSFPQKKMNEEWANCTSRSPLLSLRHWTADKNWQGSFLSLSVWPRHQEEQVPQEDKDGGIFPGNGREVPFWLAQVAVDQVLGNAGEI